MNFEHARGEQFSSGVLWPELKKFAYDAANTHWVNTLFSFFEQAIGPQLHRSSPSESSIHLW